MAHTVTENGGINFHGKGGVDKGGIISTSRCNCNIFHLYPTLYAEVECKT
jgi:hypothetical protein